MIRSIPIIFAERAVKHLIRRFFGQYLEFAHQELTWSLKKGKGVLQDVSLNVEALNELSEDYNLPIEFLRGSIDNVSVEIPWTKPFTENSIIEFKGMNLVIQPKKCADDVSMFGSMWESMTTSLQLAEECLQEKLENEPEFVSTEPIDAVNLMVSAINLVVAKMKFKLVDTVIKIENVLECGDIGVALEIRIKSAECFDEIGVETSSGSNENLSAYESSGNQTTAYSVKKCMLEGISLYTALFSTSSTSGGEMPTTSSETYLSPGSPEMPPPHTSLHSDKKASEGILPTEPILISRINGQQQLRLKLKQNEGIVGPKVDIEANLGLVNLFLTPFQVHMLIELAHGLAKPSSSAKNNSSKCPPTASNRPMRPEDFALIEQELQRQNKKLSGHSRSLQNHCGWSSQCLDDSGEEFHLMTMENKVPLEVPVINEELESSCSSSLTSESLPYTSCTGGSDGCSTRRKSKSSTLQTLLTDSLTESTQLRASCSSLCIVILHEDAIMDPTNKDSILLNYRSDENIAFLQSRAEKYFDELTTLALEGLDFKDFSSVKEKISRLCQTNQIRILASSVTFEGSEKTSTAQRLFSTALTMLDLEISECVFNIAADGSLPAKLSCTELMSFNQNNLKTNFGNLKEPCVRIKYDRIDYGSQTRLTKLPANKITFHLAPVAVEVDISLTDRIRAFLNPDPIFNRRTKHFESSHFSWREENISRRMSQKTEVQVTSPFLIVNLRFPIPDFRSPHDMERAPWWQQNLRKEILVMEMIDTSLAFTVDSEQIEQKIELQCRDFHGLFKMSENEDPLSFLRVSVDPEAEKAVSDKGFDWPRLVLHIIPKKPDDLLEYGLMTDKEDLCPVSFTDTILSNMDKEPSPFCSNAVFYGSDFNVNESQDKNKNNQHISSEDDELIKPADKDKILNFIDQTIDRSLFVLDFFLPAVNASFPDKQFFELLYNRLCDDLILWENAPVNILYNHDSGGFNVHAPAFDLNPQALKDSSACKMFYNCPSNNFADSNSESDEEEGRYYSVSEQYMKHRQRSKKAARSFDYTKISVNMNIQKGAVAICNSLLDNAGSVVPGYCSRMQLVVEECKFFLASSFKGDPYQSYLCLLSNKGTLYHKGSALFPIERQVVQPFSQSHLKNQDPIIYRSEVGIPSSNGVMTGCGGDSADVLSIAVHTMRDNKQQIKTYKIAIGISGTSLRHHMCPASQLWLNQLIDFIAVTDYPISGYIAPAVVVELHLHLGNCAIDYRPLYLPLKTVLTFENFSLSTNITASTKTSLLRIISEELCLFISSNMNAKSVDLKKDYVCVLDTGLIDLSVRLTNSEGKSDPKFEICASNNMIHIRTCADSCRALQQLVVYFASYGDLADAIPNITNVTDETNKKPKPVSSPPATENVHNLMVEAMKEYSSPKHSGNGTHSDSDFSTDEEFCILENDPGVGVIPKNKEPQIRVLTAESIRILDNHFNIPTGKSDLLKAPKHFPQAVLCHTLREMSITWHLYGGNDFSNPKCSEKKHVRISKQDSKEGHGSECSPTDDNQSVNIDAGKNTIAFCKVTPLTRDFYPTAVLYTMENFSIDHSHNNSNRSWILRGGEGRDHDVLMELQMHKVRFQHEEYPEDSEYASRDVLLIHDIEIKDKLASSQINKFLYQYSSESMPRQTHANMVVVKAVHVRPDPNNKKIQECSLKVSCKPLRLNIDQDALMFLYDFFKELSKESPPGTPQKEGSMQDLQVHSVFSSSPSSGSSEDNKNPLFSPVSPPSSHNRDINSLTFFRSFSFSPDVLIRLDYQGKRVVMEQGALQGILMGLGQLNCSEIKLKRLSYRHGFLGAEKLMTYAANEWLQDVKKNQLPSLLGGIGPMHSFVQLFQGLKDLIWLPVEQYRKDGQIVRGLQRGASSFTTSTAAAFLELTSRLFGAIQEAAEVAYDMVSPGPTIASSRVPRNFNQNRRTSQPADIREGMTTAYNVVKEGLGDTARTIVQVATVEHEHKGVRGAVGGVLRQIPPATVKPIILGTEATCIMLGGMKHQLVPDAHKEAKDKWRTKNN